MFHLTFVLSSRFLFFSWVCHNKLVDFTTTTTLYLKKTTVDKLYFTVHFKKEALKCIFLPEHAVK